MNIRWQQARIGRQDGLGNGIPPSVPSHSKNTINHAPRDSSSSSSQTWMISHPQAFRNCSMKPSTLRPCLHTVWWTARLQVAEQRPVRLTPLPTGISIAGLGHRAPKPKTLHTKTCGSAAVERTQLLPRTSKKVFKSPCSVHLYL